MKPELKRLGLHYTRTDLHLKEKWLREHAGEDLPTERIPDYMIGKLIKGRQVTRSLWYLRQM
jgi:metallopeptidase MepB